MEVCVGLMIKDKVFSLKPSERMLYFPNSSTLTVSIKASCQMQSIQLVNSWVAGVYVRILRKYTGKQKFIDSEAKQLYTIGKYRLTHGGKFGNAEVSQKLVDLYWSWVWNPEIVGNPPRITYKIPMRMTEHTVVVEPPKNTVHFNGLWLKFSSLVSKQRISIPLKVTPHLHRFVGLANIALTVYVRKTRIGWQFLFTDKSEEPTFDGSVGKVGIDVGLNTLAATSSGELHGYKFKKKFEYLKKRVQDARANRQRQGLKDDSLKLWKLEQRLSGQIKTAVGSIANKLVKKYKDHTFVVEDLDLSGCKGSKRFAYKALQSSLARKAVIEKINPAYTSQQCPSCGCIDKNNRNGIKFSCKSCGRKAHADFVGGFNILRRSENKNIGLKTSPKEAKVILRERYLRNRNSSSKLPGRKTKIKRACTDKPETHYGEMPQSLKSGSTEKLT